MARMLVLDFDGTMTDAEVEGAPFRGGYLGDLAVLTGASSEEVERLASEIEAEVAADPDSHGWLFDGHIVAPATVDPYLRIMPVARRIFDHFGAFPREADRTRLLDGILYKYNYGKTVTAFRAGAGDALRDLTGTPTWIVTNSHTTPVQAKVRDLGARSDGGNDLGWLVERVHGRARKYVLDATFDAVPESIALPGLQRPVLLRRRHYHDVLVALMAEAGAQWSDLTVVGDIFELDLSLPLAMGARVGLLANRFTPEYEKNFLLGHERGAVLRELSEIRAFAQL